MARQSTQPIRRSAGRTVPVHGSQANPRPAAAARDRVACCTISALLVAAVALVYAQTYHYGFVSIDDDDYVATNSHLHGGLTADSFAWAFTTNRTMNWHPLTWLSLLLDCAMLRDNLGRRLSSHERRLARRQRRLVVPASAVGHGPTLAGARSWRPSSPLHPARVESVAWVTERKDVLSGLFGLLSIWAYVWYTRAPGLVRYFLVVLAFALGLMCKSTLVTWPFVFLALGLLAAAAAFWLAVVAGKGPVAAGGGRLRRGYLPLPAGGRRRLLAGLRADFGKDRAAPRCCTLAIWASPPGRSI